MPGDTLAGGGGLEGRSSLHSIKVTSKEGFRTTLGKPRVATISLYQYAAGSQVERIRTPGQSSRPALVPLCPRTSHLVRQGASGEEMSATGRPRAQTVESRALPVVTALCLPPAPRTSLNSILCLHDCLSQLRAAVLQLGCGNSSLAPSHPTASSGLPGHAKNSGQNMKRCSTEITLPTC